MQSFVTPATALVSTGSAQSITRTSAMVSGSVNPSGENTTYHFVFVEAAQYAPGATECPSEQACAYAGGRATQNVAAGGEHSPVPAQAQLTELKPGVTYHYALVASNIVGTTVGPDMTLTTAPPTPPLVSTGGASGVSTNTATITGSVDTQGLPSTVRFEFGTTPGAGSSVPATITGVSGAGLTVAASFAGTLQPGVTYYYRLIATSIDGTSYGAEGSFTTASLPPVASPPPVQLIQWPPAVLAALAAAEHETHGTTSTKPSPKKLTNAQKLTKALAACKKKPKNKRASCRRAAKKKYR